MFFERDDVLDYYQLADAVKAIDESAYEYMVKEAPKRGDFEFDECLSSCFVWEDTPQHHKFWSDINERLTKKI